MTRVTGLLGNAWAKAIEPQALMRIEVMAALIF
jgi:hypothetical protein